MVRAVTVTCDAHLYPDKSSPWKGVDRVFTPTAGKWSKFRFS